MMLLLINIVGVVKGQEKKISFSFKKGEVMDVLLLSTNVNSEKLFENYKKTAFPVAFEYTYQPQPGFRVKELVLGNHMPNSLIVGKWKSIEKRKGFLANVEKRVPDFHKQRRELFKYFTLTYYEMQKDIDFSINRAKYNVATVFWKKDTESFLKIYNKWKKEVKKHGGKLILKLENGESPLGYYYNGDVFCFIEWNDKKDFEIFTKKHPLSSYKGIKNIHQFVI